jgi:hypothetical protein
MTRIYWWLADRLSGMLEPNERDAVRGDFAESGETGGRAFREVLGLVAWRQAGMWQSWPPWLILVGLVAPVGLLLGLGSNRAAHGSSIPIWMYLNNWTMVYLETPAAQSDLLNSGTNVLRQYLVLACWSWAGGFLLGSLSRRTIPIQGALFCLAVLFVGLGEPRWSPGYGDSTAAVFSLAFYRVVFPLIVQAALVLVPSVWGMRQGVRLAAFPLPLRGALLMSVIVTVAALILMNFGWALCFTGRYQACMEWAVQVGYAHVSGRSQIIAIPVLPLALAGPVGYLFVAMVWRRYATTAAA